MFILWYWTDKREEYIYLLANGIGIYAETYTPVFAFLIEVQL